MDLARANVNFMRRVLLLDRSLGQGSPRKYQNANAMSRRLFIARKQQEV